jgi:two-component system, sensor histidine kinase PdtaS
MPTDIRPAQAVSDRIAENQRPWAQTFDIYQRELIELRQTEAALRDALAREDTLLHQKDELIRLQEILNKESDHRFLNSLQMIASLLSMQVRTAASPDTASQLAIARDRVIMIGCIHRRLHSFDGVQTVAFKPYLEELCSDFSAMLASEDGSEKMIDVDAMELDLPTATSIPLGFIVSELITNAAKHGTGPIKVRLRPDPDKGYALSIANDGPSLPEGFDPAASKGLGMTIIRSLVAKIGGQLRFGPGDQGRGAQFSVLFG